MSRMLTFGTFAGATVAAAGLYLLGHHVEGLERRLDRLNQRMVQEEQSIQVLKAEWAYLNRPARLQELALENPDCLRLAPISPQQVVTMDHLETRLADLEAAARLAASELLSRLPEPREKPAPPAPFHLASTGASR